jgi:S1-C subfamily serine protease
MWRVKQIAICVLPIALCAGVAAFTKFGAPPQHVRSVVRIDAAGCAGGKRQGSGFVWNSNQYVVTALHVVSGCNSIHVVYPAGGGRKAAILSRTLRADDLALLRVSNPPNVPPLVIAPIMPAAGQVLMAWGYPTRIRGVWDTEFIRRQSSSTLGDVLVDNLQTELAALGMPSLTRAVVWLDRGHLYPGQSGGPLFDSSNRVAAIADGGLEQGASSINWAIPATRLSGLLQSIETPPTTGASRLLFSGEVIDGGTFPTFVDPFSASLSTPLSQRVVGLSYRCGAGLLAKMDTRTLEELSQFTDDPTGLNQLITMAGGLINMSDQFDVYQHVGTGATAVVPTGTVFQSQGPLCLGSLNGGRIRLFVQTAPASTPAQVQQVSLQYEAAVGALLGPPTWQLDPAWTMAYPLTRPDGLVARRKASMQYIYGAPAKYSFASISARGGMFLGVAYVRMDVTPSRMQEQAWCLHNPGVAQCQGVLEDLVTAVRASIGVHLSTFPLG